MRGDERVQDSMFSYLTLEQRVPSDHPLREIRALTDGVLESLDGEFSKLYAATGRASIAPEYMLRALLLQAFYSIRSERQLVEQIDYNLLFRWFVGLGMDDAVWNHTVFSKNRDRLLNSEVAQQFFAAVNKQAKRFMSDDHFTVDGTLIQAWASHKSFRARMDPTAMAAMARTSTATSAPTTPMNRPPTRMRDSTRRATARSRIWPIWDTRWWRPQRPDRCGHGDASRRIRRARGRAADASRETKGQQAAHHGGRGQGLRHQGFHRGCARVERHRACDKNEKGRRSNLDRRTTRHPGYAISLSRRWLIEKGFGWLKQTGPMRQVKLRGLHNVDWLFVFSCAAHNLMRLPRLIAQRHAEGLREQCA